MGNMKWMIIMKERITKGKKLFTLFTLLLLTACARMGSPDGGWFDDTPPRVVSTSPQDKGTNVRSRKVTINFDEFIKIGLCAQAR